ncbi:MAG: alpha/beta hydrolase [Acetobacteraceae bacterium]|nr:alpha/beta hydrolase [Acetobacteraceae bacterium]
MFPITEHVAKSGQHTTFYLACGADDAPPIVFVHGWPELSISWRHQLPVFAALGFRAIAPDMRGYGRSSIYTRHEDYALEPIVGDVIALLDALGSERAVWVGHDWGSPVVWAVASHHPGRCQGVANLCVPHIPKGFAPETLVPLVNRTIYPVSDFPAGQWEYQLFYLENFAKACASFDADVSATVKILFRKGNPALKGTPSRTALVRRDGGWFKGADRAPDLPLDRDVLGEADLSRYVESLQRNGFFGPDSWYMNPERNMAYAAGSLNGGRLTMPVLFLHATSDYTCDTLYSRLADPMREACSDLTEVVVESGHWMAQENPVAVNAALARWLGVRFPMIWKSKDTGG